MNSNPRFIRIVKQMIEQKRWELKPSVEWMIGKEGMINVNSRNARVHNCKRTQIETKKCITRIRYAQGNNCTKDNGYG